MIGSALASEALLRRLNLAVLVSGAFVAVTAAGLGLSLLLANGGVARAEGDRQAAVARERTSDATLARAGKIKRLKVAPRADQQVEAFAAALARVCRAENVGLTSFDNAADAVSYAPRYGTKPVGISWKASEARVAIQGRLADIYTVLGKLKGLPIPFEVEAGTLESVPEKGQVRVGLTIAAIVREENGAGRG